MNDNAEKIRNLPAVRSRLADPMKTSREMEEIFDNLKKSPDSNQITQEIANLKISNRDLSEMISNSIIDNQKYYGDVTYDLENLSDTYEEIGMDMRDTMNDQLIELQRIRKQEEIKIRMQKKRMEIFKKNSEHLENIDEGIKETNDNISRTNENLEEMNEVLNDEFQKTQGYLSDMKQSSERVGEATYGTSIPQKKPISTLMENADFSGKLTLLALHAKGMLVDDIEDGTNTLRRTFSPSFIKYVDQKADPQEVKEICKRKKERMQIRGEEYIEAEKKFQKADKEFQELEEKKNNVSGEELDKVSTDLWEKRKERQEIIDRMQELKSNISKEKIGLLSDEEMDLLEIHQEAKTADNVLDLINMGMVDDTTLEKLLRNQSIDGEISLQIARIMEITEEGIKPKVELDGIVGINQKEKALMIQGNIALKQRGVIIKNLEGIGRYLQKNDEDIEKANKNLENINEEIERSNMFLDGILQNSEMTNDLIEESNYLLAEGNELLEEGNELTKISNHILAEIHSQIEKTGNQLTEVLENIGNAIIIGFNETLEKLDDIQMISEHIAEINEEMLQELYKQSEILSSIDKKLSTPLEIKANEYFRYGMEMLNTGKHPTKEDRKTALESFENGLKYKNTHILNLYGAGTALKNLKEDKRAAMYLERAYKLANKENNTTLCKNIAMDLAKIYTKYLKLKVAKHRIDEAITNDKENIEAFLLRARINNILNEKEEFKKVLNIIYHKIVEEGKEADIKGDYQDILKYLFKPAKNTINKHIQKGMVAKLLKIIPGVQSIGHKEATKTIIENVLFLYPRDLINSSIDIRAIIKENADYFTGQYQSYIEQDFKGGQSQNFFALAYLGYKSIDFNILDTLITTGLEFDIDYIKIKSSTIWSERKQYQANIQKKIYTLGEEAKYLLRDYLKNHPNSILST